MYIQNVAMQQYAMAWLTVDSGVRELL